MDLHRGERENRLGKSVGDLLRLNDGIHCGGAAGTLHGHIENANAKNLVGSNPAPPLTAIIPDHTHAAAEVDAKNVSFNHLEIRVTLADAGVIEPHSGRR
jgi:hypothetical protein